MSSPNIYYRIVELKNGEPHSLFHGTNRSRALPVGEWIEAEKKMVRDGAGKWYLSGFHVMPTLEEANEYFQIFKKKENRVIVPCEAEGLRPKEHSRSRVYLADRIRLIAGDTYGQ